VPTPTPLLHDRAHEYTAPPTGPFPISSIDLGADREEVEGLWRDSQAQYVRLSLAAAFVFHQTRRGNEAALTGNEYAEALDIAATVLACLVPIYTVNGLGKWTAVVIDLSRHKFRGGATQLQRADGAFMTPMSIVRDDARHALQEVARAGLEIAYQAPRRPQASSL
jgi:hypothetical protein